MASTTYNPQSERKGSEHTDKAKDAGSEALNKGKEAGKEGMAAVKDNAGNAMDKVKDTAGNAMDKAKDMGTDVMGKARDAASAVGDMATTAATSVGQRAEDMAAAAGHGIRGWGDKLAQNAPHEGMAGTASQALAEGIRGTGRYIEESRLSGMAQDVEHMVQRHPVPAILICLGIGFCLGRIMSD